MSVSQRRLGRYELRELLGRESRVEEWKAFDTLLQQYVIIKLIHADLKNDPGFLERIEQEAQVIGSLRHPNIVRVRDFQISHPPEADDTVAYLVTDNIEGLHLSDYIRTTSAIKNFPSRDAIVEMFASISMAIDYAHQQGAIHRNINPTNILLDTRNTSHNPVGEPLLTDFGIAAMVGIPSRVREGTFQGNLDYLAPEQIQGYNGNELSDMYSLGVILYEICTGALPYQGNSPTAQLAQNANATPRPPAIFNPDIPPTLTMVLLRSLAKDPAGRFQNAIELSSALAEALNIPYPDRLPIAGSPSDSMNLPTYLTPGQFNLPPGMTPSSQGWPLVGSSSPVPARTFSTSPGTSSSPAIPSAVQAMQPSSVSPASGQSTLLTPTGSIPGVSPAYVPAGTPAMPSSKPTGVFPPPAAPKKRRRGLMAALIGMVLIIVGAAVLGAFYLLPRTGSVTPSSSVVGQAFFISSGQTNRYSNQGLNDGLQITLQNISPPAPGKSYYAWLLGDKGETESASILLGTLIISPGQAHLTYNDKDHNNLLASTSQLLITEEDTNPVPISPSPDKSTWRYSGVLPQARAPGAEFSLLDHLRHLLSADPKLNALGLRGGLAIWLAKNTEKVMVWSGSARDYWREKNTVQMRAQLIRILDALDSAVYVQAVGDVPPGTPAYVDASDARVALLEFDTQKQDPPGYLNHISRHLNGVITAPGATGTQVKLAAKIAQALNNVTKDLERVRMDAKQLELTRDDRQLLSQSALSTLDDMATQALYAYIGQLDPTTNQVVDGVVQVRNNLELLAAFDIRLYSSK